MLIIQWFLGVAVNKVCGGVDNELKRTLIVCQDTGHVDCTLSAEHFFRNLVVAEAAVSACADLDFGRAHLEVLAYGIGQDSVRYP